MVQVLVRVPRLVDSYGASSVGSQARDVDDTVTSGSPGGEGRGGLGSGNKDWIEKNPITDPGPHAKIPEPVKGNVNDSVEGITETVMGVAEDLGELDPSTIAGPIIADPSWLDDVTRK